MTSVATPAVSTPATSTTVSHGPPGPFRVLTRVLFVDGGAAPSAQDGSLAQPFLTIQAAIHAIPIPTNVAASAEDWTILIAPGDYDENLQITGPVRLALIGLSGFRLGRYTVAGGPQANIVAVEGSTPRNIVWTYHGGQAVPGGAVPQLVIGTIVGTDVVRPGKPIANRISGSIIVEGDDWIEQLPNGTTRVKGANGGTAFLAVANTQVDAGIRQDPTVTRRETPPTQPAIDTTGSMPNHRAFTGILGDRHFNSRFRGAIRGVSNGGAGPSAYGLVSSFASQYEQLVEVSGYSSIDRAAFAAGMSVSEAPRMGSLRSVVPPGIFNSTFSGTFTGPARSLLLDAATNTWFIRNGAVANGGAKAYLGGASQTLSIAASRALEVDDCGVTLLANATAGPFAVTLPQAVDDLTFTIKNVGGANSISVASAIGEQIDGMSSVTLVPPGAHAPGVSGIRIVAQGARWWIVAQA